MRFLACFVDPCLDRVSILSIEGIAVVQQLQLKRSATKLPLIASFIGHGGVNSRNSTRPAPYV